MTFVILPVEADPGKIAHWPKNIAFLQPWFFHTQISKELHPQFHSPGTVPEKSQLFGVKSWLLFV
jgi:hypothetical protein